ncbi:hypothetical protein HDV04_004431 [Boothiomyces sp. JEL0838]|nr:hypothetical protein HDV04_004431 [Boothiomyces sp. JEL0838]
MQKRASLKSTLLYLVTASFAAAKQTYFECRMDQPPFQIPYALSFSVNLAGCQQDPRCIVTNSYPAQIGYWQTGSDFITGNSISTKVDTWNCGPFPSGEWGCAQCSVSITGQPASTCGCVRDQHSMSCSCTVTLEQ